MRTMLRLESYDAAMLSGGLKYSLVVGGRGKYDRFYRQTSGEIRCLYTLVTALRLLQSRHRLHTEKCANLNFALMVGIEICTF